MVWMKNTEYMQNVITKSVPNAIPLLSNFFAMNVECTHNMHGMITRYCLDGLTYYPSREHVIGCYYGRKKGFASWPIETLQTE